MNILYKIFIFIILTIVNYYGDRKINNFKHNYNSILGYVFLFLHSIISTYFIFGSFIFGYYELHLIYILSISLQLYLRNYNCWLQDQINYHFNDNKKIEFYSNNKQLLHYLFNVKIKTIDKYSNFIGITTFSILLIFDIYIIHNKI